MPRVQLVPALAENHVAGKPFAPPTATWLLPSAAMSSTATCGSTAPGMRAKLTGVSLPALSRVSVGCWPSGPAAVLPAATTAPPVVTATPAMVPAVALPSTPTGRQAVPLALVNARRLPALLPVITAPAGPPSTVATVSPARPWAVTVVANFQAAPSAEVNTTAPVPALDWPGRTATSPFAVAASPATAAVAPLLTGTVTAVQVAPLSVLRHTPDERTVTARWFAPVPCAALAVTTPETTMFRPVTAADVRAPAVPPPAVRRS